jgi:hypothetical protein
MENTTVAAAPTWRQRWWAPARAPDTTSSTSSPAPTHRRRPCSPFAAVLTEQRPATASRRHPHGWGGRQLTWPRSSVSLALRSFTSLRRQSWRGRSWRHHHHLQHRSRGGWRPKLVPWIPMHDVHRDGRPVEALELAVARVLDQHGGRIRHLAVRHFRSRAPIWLSICCLGRRVAEEANRDGLSSTRYTGTRRRLDWGDGGGLHREESSTSSI